MIDSAAAESLLSYRGPLELEFCGRRLALDLRHRHERAYATKLLLGARHAQVDIDEMLFATVIRAGDRVLDAGAHVGFTALEMIAAGAREVVALEPVPEIFERLRRIGSDGVIPEPFALASASGDARLVVSSSHNQGSSLKDEMLDVFPAVFGEAPERIQVRTTTVDELVGRHGAFDVWKLDVEGAESDALRGAARTLSDAPPRAIVVELYERFYEEFHQLAVRTHPHVVRGYIRASGYSLLLTDPRSPPDEDVLVTSPMYVFSRHAPPAA